MAINNENEILYNPKDVAEEEKFAKEMVADINKGYGDEVIKYLKHEHSDKYNEERHLIEINIITAGMIYELNFKGMIAFFNGMQMGNIIMQNRIATSVMALQEEFAEILKGLTQNGTDPANKDKIN